MGFGTILFIAVIIAIVAIIVQFSNNKKHKEETQIAISGIPDYTATDTYLSESSGISISFDNQRKKICLIDKLHKSYLYSYDKILQCEIVVDGETVLKQSTSGTIGRSVLGGILTGGVGAIIGGTTASKTHKENISRIDLKIIIDDTSNPVFRINFMNIKTKKKSFIYRASYSQVEKWHGILAGLIRQGNTEDAVKQNENLSVADELMKLKNLNDIGVITSEEFAKQKSKLIG